VVHGTVYGCVVKYVCSVCMFLWIQNVMVILAIVDAHRPQTIVSDLSFSLDTNQDSAHLQIAVMSFINAIVNYKAGEVH